MPSRCSIGATTTSSGRVVIDIAVVCAVIGWKSHLRRGLYSAKTKGLRTQKLCQNGWTDRDGAFGVWNGCTEPCICSVSESSRGKAHFCGVYGIWTLLLGHAGADSFAPCPYAVRRDGLVAAGVRSIRLDRPTSKMHRAPATRRTRASSQVWPD